LTKYQRAKAHRDARFAELKTAEEAHAPRKAELATASKAVQALANQMKTRVSNLNDIIHF
jgi:hypothetical protein